MANSTTDLRFACVACLLIAAGLALPGPTYARNGDLPIHLEAASSDFDYKNNALLFRRIKITQGSLQVQAEEARANGLNFENSEWTFTGSVHILMPDGELNSDQARVTFRNNEISSAVINGKPASFEQRLEDEQQLAQGRAQAIQYDVQAGTVRLNGNAWLTDGRNEIRGDTLIYNIGQQRVVANPTGGPGGVRITINPRTEPTTTEPPQDPAP